MYTQNTWYVNVSTDGLFEVVSEFTLPPTPFPKHIHTSLKWEFFVKACNPAVTDCLTYILVGVDKRLGQFEPFELLLLFTNTLCFYIIFVSKCSCQVGDQVWKNAHFEVFVLKILRPLFYFVDTQRASFTDENSYSKTGLRSRSGRIY